MTNSISPLANFASLTMAAVPLLAVIAAISTQLVAFI